MKRLIFLLTVFCFIGSAFADENNLSGGVLIAHAPGQMQYCYMPCEFYDMEGGIEDAAGQVTRYDPALSGEFFYWYVVAGFAEDKTWCGTQFGLGDYNSESFYIENWACCLDGHLEITTDDWPGPIEGTALVATHTPWQGNFRPIYWFGGYAYGDPVVIPIDVDPSLDFVGFGNCLAPPSVWPAQAGALGIGTDGVAVYPVIEPTLLACCDEDGGCELMDPVDCLAAGGTVEGSDSCDPNPCYIPPPLQACCDEFGECELMIAEDCLAAGGSVDESTTCDPNPCPIPPPLLACCDDDGGCELMTTEDCLAAGGLVEGSDSCDPNPCEEMPFRACCFYDGSCIVMSPKECLTSGGSVYNEYATCDPNPCSADPQGACCDVYENCTITYEFECPNGWLGPDIDCEPNPCYGSPTQKRSWGSIKTIFR